MALRVTYKVRKKLSPGNGTRPWTRTQGGIVGKGKDTGALSHRARM